MKLYRSIIINVHRSKYKVPVTLLRLYWKLTFLDIFSKKKTKLTIRENPSGGSHIVSCDGMERPTKRTKPIIGFRNFANARKSEVRY